MIANIAVLAAAVCIAVTSAKVCLPDQFQGTQLGKIGQIYKGNPQVVVAIGKEYVDFTKKMTSTWVTLEMKDYPRFKVTLINDLNKMKTYEIHPDERSCTTVPLILPQYRQYCDGDEDLKLVETLTVGGRPAGVYKLTYPNATVEMTLMKDDFSRVSNIIEMNIFGLPQMIANQYANTSTKITDEGVFDVPSYCSSDVENSGESDEIRRDKSNTQISQAQPRSISRVCAPDQFEVLAQGQLAQVPSGHLMTLPLSMKQSFDFKNKMEVSVSDLMYNGQLIRTTSIIDWKKGKMYNINRDKKTCHVLPSPGEDMIEMCSDNPKLTHLYEFSLNGQMADTYSILIPDIDSSVMSVFRDTFEVITSVSAQKFVPTIPQMLAFQFGNMTTGIADPSVFDLPDYCNQ